MRSLNIDSDSINQAYVHPRRISASLNFEHESKRRRRYVNHFAPSRIIAIFEHP
jgi:hypothetical protein